MRKLAGVVLGVALSTTLMGAKLTEPDLKEKPAGGTYPSTRQEPVVDQYHGVSVPDPYRWLEQGDSQATRNWIATQNQFTQAHLRTLGLRAHILQRLTRLWNYERLGVPFRRAGKQFFYKNTGLQNQSVLYVRTAPDAEAKVLLDPNTLSKDGTVALSGTSISPDGRYVAYGNSNGGSDWQQWRVRDIASGKDLSDTLDWIKFSGAAWRKDNQGFYYARYEKPVKGQALQAINANQKLYFHRVGTKQSADVLVYARPDQPQWGFAPSLSEDGRYLVLHITHGTDPNNRIYVMDLRAKQPVMQPLLDAQDAAYDFIGNQGTVFWFKTTLDAERGRVIAVDINQSDREHWKELIPESADNLDIVDWINQQFVLTYLHNAHHRVAIHETDGRFVREVPLPGIGSVSGFYGEPGDTETWFAFSGMASPQVIYHYDFKTATARLEQKPTLAFNPDDYETKQVWYASKDGTRVPMFIAHRRGLELNGDNPTFLYGYGGFNVALTPSFSVSDLVWMEMGGVYAMPNLRGGGEFGEKWHRAGTKLQKQNVFDDFIAAAEYLIANRYTNSRRLAIGGASNGGLLVGACLTQRPDLFAAAVPKVGVLDMLRYHKFTIGWGWAPDYGTADDPEEFKALYAYSPLHRVRLGTEYPATLIVTGDHDDRVVPAHSFKFAATLQAAQKGSKPVLIRIGHKAGHGAGKPTARIIEEFSDIWAFVCHALGVTVKEDASVSH
jgi:prolyl oligopeptidase